MKDLRFVYDGWNMIAELDHTFATGTGLAGSRVVRRYVWGPDLAGQATLGQGPGTFQGAGGVGGLLAMEFQGTTYFPCYGTNGNIMGWKESARPGEAVGRLIARYDYDPFGNRITNTGPDVELCPFGFSTKYRDEETEMLYYGFRYYSPEMGRWPSRDPIGERGGINLYGMVRNDPVNRWDRLGLTDFMGPPLPPSPGTETPNTGGAGNGNCIGAACGTGDYHRPTDDELKPAREGDPQKFLNGYNPMGNRAKCRLVASTHFDNNNTMMQSPCKDCEREVICVAFVRKSGSFEMHCIGRTVPGEGGSGPAYDSKNGFDGNNVTGISDPLTHFGNTLPPRDKIHKAGRATYCCDQAKK